MLLGTYEPKSTPWHVKGTPMTFGHELLRSKVGKYSRSSGNWF